MTQASCRIGVTAVVGSLLLLTGCDVATPASTTKPEATSATTASPTSTEGPATVPITMPPTAIGEIARSVARPDSITSTRSARARGGVEYVVRGQCRSELDGDSYTYMVKVDGAESSSGDFPCDGSLMVNSLGPVKARANVAITLTPSDEGTIGTAYVIVAPAP